MHACTVDSPWSKPGPRGSESRQLLMIPISFSSCPLWSLAPGPDGFICGDLKFLHQNLVRHLCQRELQGQSLLATFLHLPVSSLHMHLLLVPTGRPEALLCCAPEKHPMFCVCWCWISSFPELPFWVAFTCLPDELLFGLFSLVCSWNGDALLLFPK
jgi:hypothetical protein